MLSAIRGHVMEQVKSAKLVVQANETTDISTQIRMVLVVRYSNVQRAVQENVFLAFACCGCNI